MKQLHLVVPGLLGPFANDISEQVKSQLKQPEFAQINKVLARAKYIEIVNDSKINQVNFDPFFQTLRQLIYPECEQSICQLMTNFDEIDTANGYFYCADPVHFKAESDHAILLGPELLTAEPDEVSALITSFNQHFHDDKLSLHSNNTKRWYLSSERRLNLSFNALNFSLGRDIKHFLPHGEDEIWWRKNLNEAQMLFFQHEVNVKRESEGKLVINGLWLWDQVNHSNGLKIIPPDQLYSDNAIAVALGHQVGIKAESIEMMNEINGNAVMVIDSLYEPVCYGDINAWQNDLLQFCNTDFQRIMTLLKTKKIDELCIYPCNGSVFKINRSRLLKFWKQGNIEPIKIS